MTDNDRKFCIPRSAPLSIRNRLKRYMHKWTMCLVDIERGAGELDSREIINTGISPIGIQMNVKRVIITVVMMEERILSA